MKWGHWLAVIVAFFIGVIAGFAGGRAPAKIIGLETRIQELTAENAQLKSRLTTLPAPASQAPAVTPATTSTVK